MVLPEPQQVLPTIEVIIERTQGCAQYLPLVEKYDWDARIALAVMEAESHCKTDAVGDTWEIGGIVAPSCGLMQVRTIAEWRGTCEQLHNPEFNIDIAYKVYVGQGWKAWSVFNNGAYKKYL